MIVFVHQPEYIPWLGFFDKLARCDTFVIYDDAQYQHGGFHNRNRIRTSRGWEWLTVPIVHGHPQTIKNVKISGDNWKDKHLNAISLNYQKTPFFKEYFPIIKEAIKSNQQYLMNVNLHLIEAIADLLNIKVHMVRSSEFPYCGHEKNEKLISICKYLGAETYLSGSGGRTYVRESLFREAEIRLYWHNYLHPIYKQYFEGFEPNMSIVDLLFNLGPRAKEIVMAGGKLEVNKPAETIALSETLIMGQENVVRA